jgi:hypothetical protein
MKGQVTEFGLPAAVIDRLRIGTPECPVLLRYHISPFFFDRVASVQQALNVAFVALINNQGSLSSFKFTPSLFTVHQHASVSSQPTVWLHITPASARGWNWWDPVDHPADNKAVSHMASMSSNGWENIYFLLVPTRDEVANHLSNPYQWAALGAEIPASIRDHWVPFKNWALWGGPGFHLLPPPVPQRHLGCSIL